MKKPSKKVIISLCCVLAVGVGVGAAWLYMSRSPVTPASATAAEHPVAVRTARPETGVLAVESAYIGRIQPDESVSVFPKLSGTVAATYFEVGDAVKKGDLLFEIDPQDIQTQLAVAEAGYNVALAQIGQSTGSGYDTRVAQAKGSMDAAQANYNTARSNLKTWNDANDDKISGLEKKISKLETEIKSLPVDDPKLDALEEELRALRDSYKDADADDDPTHRQMRTAYNNAQIAYNNAKEAYDLLVGEGKAELEGTADAQTSQAEASYRSALKQLENTKIYAPIDGVIDSKNIQQHNLTSPQSAAYTVANKNIMTVVFHVPASAAETLQVGDEVTIENGAKTLKGSLVEVGTKADQSSGLFPVKARIDGEDAPVLSGVAVKIIAATAKTENALLLPINSIYREGEKAYVYVMQEGKAVKTYVETGLTDDEQIEILSGVTPEMQIISTWHPNLTDGSMVSEAAASSEVQ